MGRALPAGPQAAGLWGLIKDHRSALEHDWRTRYGMTVSAFLRREVSWAEAWDLTVPILRDPDSHVTAALVGWSYVPGPMQRVMTDVFEMYVNAKRGRGTIRWEAPRPWTRAAPKQPGRLSEEDRAARARLNELLFGTPDADRLAPDLDAVHGVFDTPEMGDPATD